jgi:hypothetical protein
MNPDELFGPKPRTESPGPPKGPRLIQTQLNRIVNPPLICFETFTKWLLRFRDRATYTSPDLEERLRDLDSEIPLAKQAADQLTTVEEWVKAMDRHDRLCGQRMAIRETLRQRSSGAAITSPRYSPIPEELSTLPPEFDPDPFRD